MRRWIVLIIIVLVAGGAWLVLHSKKNDGTTYQTAAATKGTLVVSVSATGQMNSNNRVPVTTGLTGTVSSVLVKEGDTVTAGQSILHITLDAAGQLAADKAQASLLSAQNALSAALQAVTSATNDITNAQNSIITAQQAKTSLHRDLLNAQSAVITAQSDYDNAVNTNASSTTIEQKKLALNAAKDAQTIAQSKYNNADSAITQAKNAVTLAKQKATSTKQSVTVAQTNLTVAEQASAQSDGIITAPVAGTIGDITYTAGMVLASSSLNAASSSAANSTTQVATVMTATLPTGSFSLAETDVPKVSNGQKVTLTLDALPGKTYTGTVVGVNRTGSISSGVTTYPITVQLDAVSPDILPNMSATANVITLTKENVLMVPIAAVKTANGASVVTILENNQPSTVTVGVGDSSDAETEVTSGLAEGQTVVTATITASTSSANTNSAFGGGLRIGGGTRTFGR